MTREPLKKRLQTHYKIFGVGGGVGIDLFRHT